MKLRSWSVRPAHVGIGADRYATGRQIETNFHPDVFLLDDGFQHRRLSRALDLVMIDALDPLAGCEVFPLGRLREPFAPYPPPMHSLLFAPRPIATTGAFRSSCTHGTRALPSSAQPLSPNTGSTKEPKILPIRRKVRWRPSADWPTPPLFGKLWRPCAFRPRSDGCLTIITAIAGRNCSGWPTRRACTVGRS